MEEPRPAQGTPDPLPAPEQALEWLAAMTLIRRFEERAAEMYAKARIGGFLHLSIGEEAAIVGAVRALRATDPLISTYRSHGHCIARGTPPERVMAELFGREDGVCRGRGGSMHMFDAERRFMGGFGIVGGNLPIAAGFALTADVLGTDDVTLCVFGDGAANQGTFGETLNVAALWGLPVVFMVTNNHFGMGTSIERHSAMTELWRRGEAYGVPAVRCDGMDPVSTHAAVATAVQQARTERHPVLVEAEVLRFRGHSVSDPDEGRGDAHAERWRRQDPLAAWTDRLLAGGLLDEAGAEEVDRAAVEVVDGAVAFAEASPFPDPGTLYDHVLAPVTTVDRAPGA